MLCVFNMSSTLLWCVLVLILIQNRTNAKFDSKKRSGSKTNEAEAFAYISKFDEIASRNCRDATEARFAFETSPTVTKQHEMSKNVFHAALFEREAHKHTTKFAWDKFRSPQLKRWFKFASVAQEAFYPEDLQSKLASAKQTMTKSYDDTTFCHLGRLYGSCDLKFVPHLNNKMANLKLAYDEHLFYWSQFMSKIARETSGAFKDYVEAANEGAKLNGYSNAGDQWKSEYEVDDFEDLCIKLWDKIKPLYLHIHAYIRKKLREQHGEDKILENGPIPAHTLGSMWAQSWKPLMQMYAPYPNVTTFNATPQLQEKKYSVSDMVKLADRFFQSIGFDGVSKGFMKKSYLVSSADGAGTNCQATSWDLCDGQDFRIKMCVDTTMSHMITLHHEMGHIQYYMNYAHLPKYFREAANPGFHEAIGDVIALSVSTPTYLSQAGLLSDAEKKVSNNPKADINFLMSMALDKIAFLPSALIFDLWRWRVFDGRVPPGKLNTDFYKLRLEYQGLCPGSKRLDIEMDALGKFHVANGMTIISYFVSYILQFQLHKELCVQSGFTGPLHKCSIYKSKKAGKILRNIMKSGASRPWTEVIGMLTNNRTFTLEEEPILEYFEPLRVWLEEENKGETLGWNDDIDPTICPNHDKSRKDLKKASPFESHPCSITTPTYCGLAG